jgi:hypothetical protein
MGMELRERDCAGKRLGTIRPTRSPDSESEVMCDLGNARAIHGTTIQILGALGPLATLKAGSVHSTTTPPSCLAEECDSRE